jgi:hypothetical protein
LLHHDAREALGIDLIDQVVVIDEAHSEYFTMTPGHGSIYEFARPHIVFTCVIHCGAPTWYSQRLFGTANRVHIKIQEQIGFKTCAPPKAPVPPSSHSEGPALELAAAKFKRGDDSR